MNRVAAALVDSLEQPERSEADRVVRECMSQVFDDVERDRYMQPLEHACGALGVHRRDDGIELAMHEMDTRADACAACRQARLARRKGDDGGGNAGDLHGLERERAALRETHQYGAARGDARGHLLAARAILENGERRGNAPAGGVAMQAAR